MQGDQAAPATVYIDLVDLVASPGFRAGYLPSHRLLGAPRTSTPPLNRSISCLVGQVFSNGRWITRGRCRSGLLSGVFRCCASPSARLFARVFGDRYRCPLRVFLCEASRAWRLRTPSSLWHTLTNTEHLPKYTYIFGRASVFVVRLRGGPYAGPPVMCF